MVDQQWSTSHQFPHGLTSLNDLIVISQTYKLSKSPSITAVNSLSSLVGLTSYFDLVTKYQVIKLY